MTRIITPFKFKQFTVHHDRCSMKVGTDAVLLGAWVNVANTESILEIGAGSGVISLMLAQRTPDKTTIEAVEIEKEDVKQALENVANSPWPEKIKIHHQPLQNFETHKSFDLIVSNPPYFINSQLPPSGKRSQARHIGSLSYPALISHSLNLLNASGRLAVVLPFEEGKQFQSLAHKNDLHTIRQLSFFSRVGKPQERWLFEFSFKPGELILESLTLHNEGEDWSDEYKTLTKDFYLKL